MSATSAYILIYSPKSRKYQIFNYPIVLSGYVCANSQPDVCAFKAPEARERDDGSLCLEPSAAAFNNEAASVRSLDKIGM